MADAVGNIYVALTVDTAGARNFTSAAASIGRDSQSIRNALGSTSRSVTSLRSSMSASFRTRFLADAIRQADSATNSFDKLRASLLGLAAVTGTPLTGIFAATMLLETADRFKQIDNNLRTVTTSSSNLLAVQKQLYAVSQDTRSSYESTVTLYSRLARAAQNFGMSQSDMMKVTSTVQKSFEIGGATPEEAAGGVIQLSQGIASNRFGGQEYKAVTKEAPVLIQAIAKQLGVTLGQLRDMSTKGELTGEVVAKAILAASGEIDDAFGKTQLTVARALTRVQNAFLMYVGAGDEATGTTSKLAGALSGLADHFDEIAKYVSIFVGLAAAAGGGKTLSKITTSLYSAFIPTKAERAAEDEKFAAQLKDIADKRRQIEAAITKASEPLATSVPQSGIGPVMPDQFARTAAARQQPAIDRATAQQTKAQEDLDKLEVDQLVTAEKLSDARAAVLEKLQAEVVAAKAANAEDAKRVGLAEQAVAAEQENLRVRQAEKLASAETTIGKRNAAVLTAQAKVVDAEKALRMKAETDIGALRDKIQANSEALVTKGISLRSTQEKIADLRSVQSLPGFDEAFGTDTAYNKQYQSLLKDQQASLVKMQQLRAASADMAAQIKAIEDGTSGSRGLSSAMTKYQAAVASAQKATESLAKAEQARDAIAAAPIGGSSLEAKIAAEARATDQFDASLGKLQVSLRNLASAAAGAFDTPATRKLASQLTSLEQEIAAAKTRLQETGAALTAAIGDEKLLLQAEADRAKVLAQINALQVESNALSDEAAVTMNRVTVGEKSMAALKGAGSSVLGFLGGWTGVAFMAAITGIGLYESSVAAAAEKTSQIKQEMADLGLISKDLAGDIGQTTESLDEMTADELRLKLRDLGETLDSMRNGQNPIDRLFHYDPQNFKNVTDALAQLENFYKTQDGSPQAISADVDVSAIDKMQTLAAAFESGNKSAKEVSAQLDKIAKTGISDQTEKLLGNLRAAVQLMAGLDGYFKKTRGDLNSLGGSGNGWVDELQSVWKTLQSAAAGHTDVKNVADNLIQKQSIAAEDQLAQMEDKIRAAAEKEAKARGENVTILQSDLEVQAKRVIAQDNLNKLQKDQVTALGEADKAAQSSYDKVQKFISTLSSTHWNAADQEGASEAQTYISMFEKGDLDAQTLQSRLNGIAETNISSPLKDLIDNIEKAIPGLATIQSLMHWAGLGPAPATQDPNEARHEANEPNDLTQLFIDDLLRKSKLTSHQVDHEALVDQIMTGPKGGAAVPRDQAEAYATQIEKNKAAALDASSAMRTGTSDAKKYADGMAKLNDAIVAAPLDDFSAKVIDTARQMGVGEDQIKAYGAALESGDIANAPAKITAIADAMAKASAINLEKSLKFDTAQLFRSPAEQQVYSSLQNTGLNPNTGQGLQIANQIRYNDILSTTESLTESIASSFMTDLQNGVSVWDALGNAAGNLEKQLLSMALNTAIAKFFQGLSGLDPNQMSSGGGILGSVLGWFGIGGSSAASSSVSSLGMGDNGVIGGFDTGGYTGDGSRLTPAGIVHKGEFVFNAAATRRIGVGRLEALQGYADGGYVGDAVNSNGSASDAQVQIINQGPPVQVKSQTKRQQGGATIKSIVIGPVKEAIADGSLDKLLGTTYGLKRQGS